MLLGKSWQQKCPMESPFLHTSLF